MRLLGLSPGIAAALMAAVAAVVVALYLLKPPPLRVTVASSLIWERVLKRKRRDADRWRWWLSLALSLAIALAIAFAIARPEADGPGTAGRQWVIVIDNSPTMGALRSDARTRLEHALDEARAIVERGGSAGRYRVIDTMGAIATPAFEDRRQALARIASIAVEVDGVPRFPVSALSTEGPADAGIVFITDGVAPVQVPTAARTVSVFEAVGNVGITAFEVRGLPGDARRFEAFVAVANAGGRPVRATLTVSGAGHAAIERAIEIPARDVTAMSLPMSDFTGGPLRASVQSADDGFDADDVAWAFLPLKKVARVALLTDGNRALEQALRLDPRIALSVLTPKQYAARTGFDAYVFDRFAPPVAPAAPALLFRPPGVPWLPPIQQVRESPALESWLEAHAVLDNVSLRDADIRRAETFAIGSGATTTLAREAGGGALMIASESTPRWIASGFAIADSNFASQASFPMFVANSIAWLLDETPAVARGLGTVAAPVERARVLTPEGNPTDTRFVPGATLFRAEAPGIYTAEGAAGRSRVIANLLEPAITDVNATRLEPAPSAELSMSRAVARPEPWVALLLAALALMLVEWWTYHRRWTV
jgi:hypothetical protein